MSRRWLWIGIPLLAIGGLWLLTRGRAVPVDVAEIVRGPIRSSVEEEARTRVTDRYLVSTPVAGRLQRIDLEEGDPVAALQVVARVDPLPAQSAVAEVEARIRATASRKAGVAEKRPKPEELEHAALVAEQAEEALAVAERELDRAQAQWERLGKDLVRVQALAAQRLVPVADLDAAVAAEDEAHQQVLAQEVRVRIASLAIAAARLDRRVLEERARDFAWEEEAYDDEIAGLDATLSRLRDDLERTEIHAPVAGVVLRRLRESQQDLPAGTPILEVGNLSGLEVEADFLSEDAAHMRAGMRAEVLGRALGDAVRAGRVARIHPSAFEKVSSLGVEQQRVTVVVVPDEPLPGLGDRYRVEVRIVLEEREDAALVPEGALFRWEGAWHVFVVEEGRARLRAVETGLRDGRWRELLAGPPPGTRVVLHPGDALEDGARVEPLP